MMTRPQNSDRTATILHDIIKGAETNDYQEVDLALEEDAESIVFQEPSSGLTALHIAAANGSHKMVLHLLSKPDVDLQLKDWRGRRPIDLAIAIGHRLIIDELSRRMYPKSFEDVPPAHTVKIVT